MGSEGNSKIIMWAKLVFGTCYPMLYGCQISRVHSVSSPHPRLFPDVLGQLLEQVLSWIPRSVCLSLSTTTWPSPDHPPLPPSLSIPYPPLSLFPPSCITPPRTPCAPPIFPGLSNPSDLCSLPGARHFDPNLTLLCLVI